MSEAEYEKAAKALQSPIERERKEAVLELLRLRDRRGVDDLARLVATDASAEIRYNARKAYYLLRDILPEKGEVPPLELPDGISLDDLEWLLRDESPRIRSEGIKLTWKLDPGTVAPLLRQVTGTETDPLLQASLLACLGRIGSTHDVPIIAGFLRTDDPQLRSSAIDALFQIGGPFAIEPVVPLLRDTDNRVRANAVRAVQTLASGELLKILRNMALSPSIELRDSAIFTLQRFKAPVAARIVAHLAAVDPDPALKKKARAALEAMARSDDDARRLLELLDAPDRKDGSVFLSDTPAEGATGPAASSLMVVPGVPPKTVKAICEGDQASREKALKELAPILTPEHASFLVQRIGRETDPRILSHLLSLVGKTKTPQSYAIVIKHLKHPDDRVRANAIEAAMLIDPVTTPDRVTGFLSDKNNRVRANSILVCATRPDFDPLVWVRDLAGFGETEFRLSALYVIERLQLPTFIPVLEMLLNDGEMEIRHLAYKTVKNFEAKGIRGARELAETASKRISRELKDAGTFDTDIHSAMNAVRAPPPPKRSSTKVEKSAGQEFGEQILGKDGLRQAGQTVKKLQAQAMAARTKVTDGLSRTTANLATGAWQEKAVLFVLLGLHVYVAATHMRLDSPIHLVYLGSATLAALASLLLLWKRRGWTACVIALILLLVPIGVSRSGILGPEPGNPSDETLQQGDSGKTPPVRRAAVASQAQPVQPPPARSLPAVQPRQPGAMVRMLRPTRGTEIDRSFSMAAKVSGKPVSVEFFLDESCIKSFDEKREGTFEYEGQRSDDQQAGSHFLKARVRDLAGNTHEDLVMVQFLDPLPGVLITSPASGAVIWRDTPLSASVAGEEYGDTEFVLDGTVVHAFPFGSPQPFSFIVPAANLAEGPHLFQVRTAMPDNRLASAAVGFRMMVPKPRLRFISPKEGEEAFRTVSVVMDADSGWKDAPVRYVRWFADGNLRQTLATPPWEGTWDITDEPVGVHEIKAVMENDIGSTAEALVRFNVIKPAFSIAVNGLKPGDVLQDDLDIRIDVVNEFPGVQLGKVVVSIDGKPLKELAAASFTCSVRVGEILSGPRKLVAEAFLSDGKSVKSTIPFSVNPRDRVGVYLSAQDEKGEPLAAKDLAGIRLEVKEDGQNVGSLTLQPAASLPAYFGVLLDVSASMMADQKLAKAKEGATAFLDGMTPDDRAFLIRFSDQAEVILEFTGDRTRLQQEIEFLTPQRGTALFDAVYEGVSMSRRVSDRTVLVVLADSGDENVAGDARASTHTIEKTIEYARGANVAIYAIGLGNQLSSVVGNGEEDLQALARETGGRFFRAGTAGEVPEIFRAVMQDVRSQTKISFRSPSGPPDDRWHTLDVSATDRKELKFLHKPGYRRF